MSGIRPRDLSFAKVISYHYAREHKHWDCKKNALYQELQQNIVRIEEF